jgi:putative acetyltransferase
MITLKRTTADDSDFQSLVVNLDKELWQRYPLTQQNFAPHNKIDLSARVLVAYKNDLAIGCGCFKPTQDPDTIEIKRMYTSPESRGLGVAKQILLGLEEWALEEGYSRSQLETGTNQPEAIALYKRLVYLPIPNYPPYEDNKESLCMAKKLQPEKEISAL